MKNLATNRKLNMRHLFLTALLWPWLGAHGALTVGDLAPGDRVVDHGWTWEHRQDDYYTGAGTVKPVTWLVAAFDHDGYPSNSVTLIAAEDVALYPFDDSTVRGSDYGCNNWEQSGQPDAAHGLRPFLNNTFFDAFSPQFQAVVLDTTLANIDSDGIPYASLDRVFVPSHTELGLTHADIPAIGQSYLAFPQILEDGFWVIWTRSPILPSRHELVRTMGDACGLAFAYFNGYVRPVINVMAGTPVHAHPLLDNTYTLFDAMQLTVGDLPHGAIVVDKSWTWEHRAGANYTGIGDIRPVRWLVVGSNHYAGIAEHVTLFTENVIARHAFDNSSNRATAYGCNHWGDSGTPDAAHGLRPFLNTTFYNAFSSAFKAAVMPLDLPNKNHLGEDYQTRDKVFVFSHTELGGFVYYFDFPGAIGRPLPYFQTDREARRFDGTIYWTRSPDQQLRRFAGYIHDVPPGDLILRNGVDASLGVRPALNLAADVRVSSFVNSDGAYEILNGHPDDPDDPAPDDRDLRLFIRANDASDTLTVTHPARVTISVALQAGAYGGYLVDWFVVAVPDDGDAWYFLDPAMHWVPFDAGMLPQCRPALQSALADVSRPVPVLHDYILPPGGYHFYFAVDYPMDGRLNMTPGLHLYDVVRVLVH